MNYTNAHAIRKEPQPRNSQRRTCLPSHRVRRELPGLPTNKISLPADTGRQRGTRVKHSAVPTPSCWGKSCAQGSCPPLWGTGEALSSSCPTEEEQKEEKRVYFCFEPRSWGLAKKTMVVLLSPGRYFSSFSLHP